MSHHENRIRPENYIPLSFRRFQNCNTYDLSRDAHISFHYWFYFLLRYQVKIKTILILKIGTFQIESIDCIFFLVKKNNFTVFVLNKLI